MEFFISWIVTTLSTMVAITVVPGIQAVGGSYAGPIMCAFALALVNAFIKPLADVLSFPLTVVTLGLFRVVINAFMLQLASGLSVGLFGSGISIDSFGSAVIGSIIIFLATTVFNSVLGVE